MQLGSCAGELARGQGLASEFSQRRLDTRRSRGPERRELAGLLERAPPTR
ncbi:MAG: hypothetical protein IPG81_12455 [Sandaracinaceae bacterium]|nr:hypothetical protein [Sandaracinaceae bacterium]